MKVNTLASPSARTTTSHIVWEMAANWKLQLKTYDRLESLPLNSDESSVENKYKKKNK